MAEKMTRKEMKAPDAFLKTGGEVWHWFEEHSKAVTIGAVVAIGGLGVAALVSYLSFRGEEGSDRALGYALKAVQRPVETGGTPAEEAQAAEKPFKTEQEKDEAVIKSLTEVRQKHRGSRSWVTAALPLGDAYRHLGKQDEAIAAFDDYLKASMPDDPLRALAYEGKGYAYESKGQLDQALATFEEMSRENKADFMSGMGLYHGARILIEQGKKEEAAKQLAQIAQSAPNTAAARMAGERLAILAGQGVVAPAPMPMFRPDGG